MFPIHRFGCAAEEAVNRFGNGFRPALQILPAQFHSMTGRQESEGASYDQGEQQQGGGKVEDQPACNFTVFHGLHPFQSWTKAQNDIPFPKSFLFPRDRGNEHPAFGAAA